jgi:uncharacterized phosphosugar-binding protein
MATFTYMKHAIALLEKIDQEQGEQMKLAAEWVADNIREDRMIHVFGTGHSHMIGIEMFVRAGGLANVNAMLDPDVLTSNGARRSGALEKLPGLADILYDQYDICTGDIMIVISNSGRNAMPIEMAMRAQKEGVKVIALTNLKQSEQITSRHPSGKRLFECADLVIDSCVPFGDAMMEVGGLPTAPGSTLSGVATINVIVNEAMMALAKEGHPLPVFASQNVDGFDNDALYDKYIGRVRHI